MSATSRWTVRVVVTLEDRAAAQASLELRLGCWLERVRELIARRDTPRTPAAAADAPGAPPPASR